MRRDKHIVFDAWSALTVVLESVCVCVCLCVCVWYTIQSCLKLSPLWMTLKTLKLLNFNKHISWFQTMHSLHHGLSNPSHIHYISICRIEGKSLKWSQQAIYIWRTKHTVLLTERMKRPIKNVTSEQQFSFVQRRSNLCVPSATTLRFSLLITNG